MKGTIAGFNQEYALTLKKTVPAKGDTEKTIKIDCTDLVILRWLVDFYPSMKKITVEGKEYAWLTHSKLANDIPLLDITKRACAERLHKFVEFGILDYRLLKEGGTFPLYAFGKNYINLVQNTTQRGDVQTTPGVLDEQHPGSGANDTRGAGQTADKDKSIKDMSVINNIHIIVEYLNQKAGKRYKATSKETQQHIRARLAEGYMLDDFRAVIDKRCTAWLGDPKMEEYLRPSTLFGPKFESYLNAPAAPQQPRPAGRGYGAPAANVGPNGIAIDPTKNDLDGLF